MARDEKSHTKPCRSITKRLKTQAKNIRKLRSVMLKNYFKIALRNLLKYKGYSFINIFGLAVGIGCCLLIFIYVKDELTYDRFQSNGDRIYRLNSMINWDGDKDLSRMTGQIEAIALTLR